MSDLHDKVVELQNSVKGLALEVEGMRKHTSSATDFILVELENLEKSIHELIEKLK